MLKQSLNSIQRNKGTESLRFLIHIFLFSIYVTLLVTQVVAQQEQAELVEACLELHQEQ